MLPPPRSCVTPTGRNGSGCSDSCPEQQLSDVSLRRCRTRGIAELRSPFVPFASITECSGLATPTLRQCQSQLRCHRRCRSLADQSKQSRPLNVYAKVTFDAARLSRSFSCSQPGFQPSEYDSELSGRPLRTEPSHRAASCAPLPSGVVCRGVTHQLG